MLVLIFYFKIIKDKMKKLTLPWSKSITNRVLILASLTEWKTKLNWILVSDDTRFMIMPLKIWE